MHLKRGSLKTVHLQNGGMRGAKKIMGLHTVVEGYAILVYFPYGMLQFDKFPQNLLNHNFL